MIDGPVTGERHLHSGPIATSVMIYGKSTSIWYTEFGRTRISRVDEVDA